VLAWQDALCRRGLSGYSVGRLVGFLQACIRWGSVAGLVPATVAAEAERVPPPPKGATPRPKVRKAVTWEQVATACGRLRSRAASDLLRVLWLTGARPSELVRVTAGAVKRTGRVMPEKGEAVELGRCWAVDLGRESKTGEERCLFFGPQAQKILAPYLRGKRPGELLFATREGKAYTAGLLTQMVRRTCGHRTGAQGREERRRWVGPLPEKWTVYQIRHAFAQRVQRHFSAAVPGAGWIAARAALGHKIQGVTAGYSGADWTTAERVCFELG
jgi:integrase